MGERQQEYINGDSISKKWNCSASAWLFPFCYLCRAEVLLGNVTFPKGLINKMLPQVLWQLVASLCQREVQVILTSVSGWLGWRRNGPLAKSIPGVTKFGTISGAYPPFGLRRYCKTLLGGNLNVTSLQWNVKTDSSCSSSAMITQ